MRELLDLAGRGDYLAIMAYVRQTPEVDQALDTLRRIFDRFESQGFIEFKAHEAIGSAPYRGKTALPPAKK